MLDYGEIEVLIDGGRWDDCEPYIRSYIDGALEVMVATHPDADHIGGLGEVLDAFIVEEIWLNGDTHTTLTYSDFMDKVNAEEAEGAQMHQAQRGDEISVSTLTFEVLHPTSSLVSNKNENSIVLKLSYGQVDFLFTGDAEGGAEASMMSASLIDDIDILKVSHHGSKYCSTVDFLSAAHPEIAIISVGANSYGHPAPETITRLQDVGATVYRTDINGTILVTTDGVTYSVETETSSATPSPSPTPTPTPTPSPSPTPTPTPTPAPTPTPTATPTPTPTDGASDVQIVYIFYDGLVPYVESDEYVAIQNLGSASQDLSEWVLTDISDGGPSFTFPYYVLDSGETIRVYTNEIHPEWGGFSFACGQAIWNNSDPDTAALLDDQGQTVSTKSY